jgi:hypothetical protein
MKDRDSMVADLQDKLLQLQTNHRAVLQQLSGAASEIQRLTGQVVEYRRSADSLRAMLEFQRATNETKLRAIDDKYNQVKKANLGLMQRIVDLELVRSQSMKSNQMPLASRSGSPVLPFGDPNGPTSGPNLMINGAATMGGDGAAGTSPLTTSTMFAPINGIHHHHSHSTGSGGSSNSPSSTSPSELATSGAAFGRSMVRRNTDSPPAVGPAARTTSSGSAAGDSRHHGFGHINNTNNSTGGNTNVGHNMNVNGNVVVGGINEWTSPAPPPPRIGFPQPQLHRPRPHLPTDDDEDGSSEGEDDQLAPLATGPSASTGVNVDDYSPPTSSGHATLNVHTQTPPGRKNDQGFDHHQQQQRHQSPSISRTNSPLRPRPLPSSNVASPHHGVGGAALPFFSNNSPSNLRKRSTSPHYPQSTSSTVASSSSSSSFSSMSLSVTMEASAMSSSTLSTLVTSPIPSSTPPHATSPANTSPLSSSTTMAAAVAAAVTTPSTISAPVMTSNLSPLLATRRAEQSAAAAAAAAAAGGAITTRARAGGPTAFLASPYSSSSSTTPSTSTQGSSSSHGHGTTTATTPGVSIAVNVPTPSALASLDLTSTLRAVPLSTAAYPTYGSATTPAASSSAANITSSNTPTIVSHSGSMHPSSSSSSHTPSSSSSTTTSSTGGSSSSALANALKSRPIPIGGGALPYGSGGPTAAMPMPIAAKKVVVAAPVRRPVMDTLDIEPSSPPSV